MFWIEFKILLFGTELNRVDIFSLIFNSIQPFPKQALVYTCLQ